MSGFPVLHHFPESAQTHVHWVSDAIQPSHPLSSPFPPALSLSQHRSLFPVSQLFASGGQSFGAIGILQILYLSGWRSTKRFSNLIFSLPKMNTLRSAFDGFWSLSSSGLVASSYESSLSVITPQCQVHRWVYTQIFRDSSCFLWFIWGIWETSGGAESPWWFCFSFSMCLTLAAVWQDSRIGGHWCFKLWQLPVSLPLTGLNPLG